MFIGSGDDPISLSIPTAEMNEKQKLLESLLVNSNNSHTIRDIKIPENNNTGQTVTIFQRENDTVYLNKNINIDFN
jgi:hypothetical protein